MKIVWDERKRLSNLDKHGLDFAGVTIEFFVSGIVLPAKNSRLKAVNFFENGVVTVVFFRLGREGLSIISMRPADKTERALLR